jgi:predicted phage tail protein
MSHVYWREQQTDTEEREVSEALIDASGDAATISVVKYGACASEWTVTTTWKTVMMRTSTWNACICMSVGEEP